MTFDNWLKALDKALRSSGSDKRVKDLDPLAMKEAFENGLSPIAFSKSPVLPLRSKDVKAARLKPTFIWLPFAFLVVLGAGAFRYVRDFSVSRDGQQRIEKSRKWPIDLPVKTESGPYYPDGTPEARELAEDHVRGLLLQPSDASFINTAAVKFNRPSDFQVDGEVEAINAFNARVRAKWSIWVRRQGEKVIYQILELEASNQSSVWKTEGGRYEGPEEKKAPSKSVAVPLRAPSFTTQHSISVSEFASLQNPRLEIASNLNGKSSEPSKVFTIQEGVTCFAWSIPFYQPGSISVTFINADTSALETYRPDPIETTKSTLFGVTPIDLPPGRYRVQVDTTMSTWRITLLRPHT